MGSVLASRAVPAVCLGMDMEAGTSGAMRTLERTRCAQLAHVISLADAETREYLVKQIVRGELPGDFAECLLRHAQVFGQQFTGIALLFRGL